jgi:hypothetical protein
MWAVVVTTLGLALATTTVHGAGHADSDGHGAACGLALAASACAIRGRQQCWRCVEQHASALKRAGCSDGTLTSWCQYGTCAAGGAFASVGYCNATASIEQRSNALVEAATTEEKASMLSATNLGISRLGVPAFVYTECLHGLKVDCAASDGACSAVFPAPIALASAFNVSLWREVGATIGLEARALYNSGGLEGAAFPYCWAPNIK